MRSPVIAPERLSLPLLLMLAAPLAAGLWLAGVAGARTVALAALAAPVGAGWLVWLCHRELGRVRDYLTQPSARPADGGDGAGGLIGLIARHDRDSREHCEALADRLEVSDSILEALPDPLLLTGSDRQIGYANRAARLLFGDRVAEGDLAAAVRHPDVLAAFDRVLAGGASCAVEFPLSGPVDHIFLARLTAFGRPPGGPRRIILSLHDITAIKRSEQLRADFVANASHELRTPLASLIGFIETLRGPARDDGEARERFLGIMHDQAGRMARLVDDLLSLSRIEQDEHTPPAARVDMVRCVGAAVAAFELKAAARRIRLRVLAAEGLPPVQGDADQLAQVLHNLISNAIKYAREQTDVTVTLAAVPGAGRGNGAGMVTIAVSDQGEGIPRTHLPRLTERFYRVDPARSRAMGGTGLGLAIVKHILNRHQGRLTIESEVGRGSTFTVWLRA
jgi:two-component system phosphate regulon sensor histidine kinase PhoR